MRRAVLVLVNVTLLFTMCAAAQSAQPLKLKVRAALYDHDLNLKPVPRLTITLANLDAPQAAPVTVQTTLDGVAETELPAGRYRLSTEKPAELFGKAYLWKLEVKVAKPEQLIELSNDNATVTDVAATRSAHVDELVERYKAVKDSIVTVWTEDSVGDGTLIDPAGLVLTSHKLIDGHKWIAVQYGDTRRLMGELVADDSHTDLAILRVNLEPLRGAFIPPISLDPGALLEGERVFTIDNNLRKGKTISTGVISKVDNESINSDVKFTDDTSPLFNSSGTVVGYSEWTNREFHIMPLVTARELISTARAKAARTEPPSGRLLPARPLGKFPTDNLIARHESTWEKDLYWFKLGDFAVDIQTPVALYQYEQQRYYAEQKQRMKGKAQNLPPLVEPEHKYLPVLVIAVSPQYKMPFWANFGNTGIQPLTVRPKSSFNKLRLLCGGKEVEPIWPRRTAIGTGTNNNIRVDQNGMEGSYEYAPDAITSSCGTVTLEVHAADDKVLTKTLDPSVVERIWKDFEPYRLAQTKSDTTHQ
jgi:hypothetical protein